MNIKTIILIILLFILLGYILLYKFESGMSTDLSLDKIALNNTKYILDNKELFDPLIEKYFTQGKQQKSSKKVELNGKIFVSVASYRDPLCAQTVDELIKKCSDPSRLRIVVCEQNNKEEDSDINLKPENYTGYNVKIIKMNSVDARGPCWARYLIQQEWSGEEYYLQIDSHTIFVENWDILCINDLNKAKQLSHNNLICLTNYVSMFDPTTKEKYVQQLRGPMYVKNIDLVEGFYRFHSDFVDKLDNPVESKGWSGCFSFSSSQIILDSPYDPHTPYLFFGEETEMLARLYTRGWLMYVPHIPICYTVFSRDYRKTFWEHPDSINCAKLSKLRLYIRLGLLNKFDNILNKISPKIKQDLDIYCLGNTKTFNDFVNYLESN